MFELRILNGLKNGISFPIDENILSVGAGENCDIFMLDADFSGAQCNLYIDSSGLVRCESISGIFKRVTGEVLGKEAIWSADDYICCGEIWLQLAEASSTWPEELPKLELNLPSNTTQKKRPSSGWRLFVIAIGLSGVTSLGLNTFSFAGLSTPSSEENTGLLIDENFLSAEEDYFDIVQKMLSKRELNQLTLKAESDALYLQGSLSSSDQRVLARMLLRYELEYPDALPIENQTDSIAESFQVHIVAVAGGPYGHIILEDGTRLTKGQSYQGYRLVKIGKKEVFFDGKATVSVKW